MKYLLLYTTLSVCFSVAANAEMIHDKIRNREIPVEITYPAARETCTADNRCAVAFLSAGYGIAHTEYSFLTKQLNQLGYMVVAIAHELPQDPPLSVEGDLYETRSENWIRGASTLDFLQNRLQSRYPNYMFDALLFVGHSNGGDISAWLANANKHYVKTIITLDNRRVPLPRTKEIGVLSIRSSDFPADKGVLPTDEEKAAYRSCVVEIPESKHNDMSDLGPSWLKEEILGALKNYLNNGVCGFPNRS